MSNNRTNSHSIQQHSKFIDVFEKDIIRRRVVRLFRRKSVKNTSIYMTGNIVAKALAFLLLPVFTRYLTTEEYGTLSYIGSLVKFLYVISTLSLNSFVLRHYFIAKTHKEKQELFGTIYLFLLIYNIFLLLSEFLLIPLAIEWFQIRIPVTPYYKIALLVNFIGIAGVLPQCYCRVTQNAYGFLFLTSSSSILRMVLGLILVAGYSMGLMGRYLGDLYASCVFFLIYLSIMFKVSSFSIDFSLIKKGLSFSLPLLPGRFAMIIVVAIDRIILERFVPVSEIGIYSIGYTLGTTLLILIRGFYYAIEPNVYRSYKEKGFNKKIVKLKDSFLYVILGFGCILIVFSREIVAIMASEAFYESYKIIPFFVISSLFRGAQILVGTTLFALNKTAYQPLIISVGLVFDVIGNLILIPIIGIAGAALASALSFWILYMVSIFITSRFSGIKWHGFRDTGLICSACGISISIMCIKLDSVAASLLIKIGFVSIFGILAYQIAIKEKMFRKSILERVLPNKNNQK